MAIKTDWHIHTHCSCDSACMEFETLVNDTKRIGITDFGVTDHYHTRIQEADIALSRKEFEETLERHPELNGHFHFGIEATLVSGWETRKIARGEYDELPVYGFRYGGPAGDEVLYDFDDAFLEKYKIEFVVGAMHWPMYCELDNEKLLKEYHRQYMFAITHPYTDILAHYLWWDRFLYPDFKNPFDDFDKIPKSMLDEIEAALIENKVAFELNSDTILGYPGLSETFWDSYLGWASDMQRKGVVLSHGGDCHSKSLSYDKNLEAEELFKRYGIDTDKFFCL